MQLFTKASIAFFSLLSIIAVARIFTFYDGLNYIHQFTSQAYDSFYNLLCAYAFCFIVYMFGLSIKMEQQIKFNRRFSALQEDYERRLDKFE